MILPKKIYENFNDFTASERRKNLFVQNKKKHFQRHVGVRSVHVRRLTMDHTDQLVVQRVHVDWRQHGSVRAR